MFSMDKRKNKKISSVLTDRERVFVGEYIISLSSKDAAEKAGYSKGTAATIASTWVSDPKKKPRVYKAIEEAMKKREHRTEVKQDRVLLELARIGFASIKDAFDENNNLKEIKDLDDDVAAAISSIEIEDLFDGRGADRTHIGYTKKIKFWNKNDALNTIAKHLGMLKEKMELTGKDGNPLVPSSIDLIVNFVKSKAEKEKE